MNKTARGFLFDFNGTLYFDHDLNFRAWEILFDELTKGQYSFEAEYQNYRGKPNRVFIEHILTLCKQPITNELIDKLSNQKESIYQRIGILEKRTTLPPGAKEFLSTIKDHHIALNMATCSIQSNLDFYFKYFNLSTWFKKDLIVYDDGVVDVTNKKGMYQLAANRINRSINECIVVEDSPSAVQDAIGAGCLGVIYINSRGVPMTDGKIIYQVNNYTQINLKELID